MIGCYSVNLPPLKMGSPEKSSFKNLTSLAINCRLKNDAQRYAVQECDATMLNSSAEAGNKRKKIC